jgi:hypothetical protein
VAPLVVLYLAVVAANSAAYHYNFWTEPSPSAAANTAISLSLWALVVLAAPVAAMAYGWMCSYAMRLGSLNVGLRRSLRPSLRALWFAAPLALATGFGLVLVVPGAAIAGLAGPTPFRRLDDDAGATRASVVGNGGSAPAAAMAAMVAAIGASFWVMVVATSLLAGVSPPAAWIVGWLWFGIAAIAVGAVTEGFAATYLAIRSGASQAASAPIDYVAYRPVVAPPAKGWRLGFPPSGPGSLAPPVKRLAARMLDGLFFFPFTVLLFALVLMVAAPHFGPIFPLDPPCPAGLAPQSCPVSNEFPGFLWLELTLFGVGLVSSAAYIIAEAAITARWGRTPGKAAMHIRPVRIDTRQPIGFWRALARAGAMAFAGMLQWIGLVDYLWCLWDENVQCVHDKVVDTVVTSDE